MVKNLCASAGRRKRHRFDPRVGKISWRRAQTPTPVFLPGESYEQRSLAGYSSWDNRVEYDWSDLSGMHAREGKALDEFIDIQRTNWAKPYFFTQKWVSAASRFLTFLILKVDEQPDPKEEQTQNKAPCSTHHLTLSRVDCAPEKRS